MRIYEAQLSIEGIREISSDSEKFIKDNKRVDLEIVNINSDTYLEHLLASLPHVRTGK